ncbi:MAG: gliding motility-associated C-terminal domain-containing protein, partial [Bacteroidales bacterium]|nr:gliding motility-associated C-terminal domain-containing protein [Bacteroidales bacterium]
VIVSYGSELADSIDFVWTESINVGGIVCTNTATKRVVFARQPVASVGAEDMAEVCGNCFEFHADTVGSGWATGFWIAKDIIVSEYDDLTIPNANICIDPISSYGDTAFVEVQFLWVMTNTGCTSMDTMFVSFYQRPAANAGLDNSICGNDYTLGAIYDCTENESYTPSGIWSVYSNPPGGLANIQPQNSDTSDVTVSHYGLWNFVFRENNSLYPGCYSTDTVQIEFIENPVISAGDDKDVCGNYTVLEAVSAGFPGSWQANGAQYDDYTDPHSACSLNVYGPKPFVWIESNQSALTTLSCSSKDTVIITFWRVPTANILTDLEDSTVCGLTFEHLRAESPGSEITGYWYNINPATVYGDEFSWNTWATVPNYGYHDFYWIEETGPGLTPGFCNDTAGPLTIRFIQIPDANAGGDTLFCGLTGFLHAIPSVGDGVWSTPSLLNVQFADENNPNTQVTSNVINTGNPTYPDFTLIWTEDNSNGCTDSDTMKVIFARVPSSNIQIIPPKCFGEPATIAAAEDSLQQYTWNFYGGIIDSVAPDNDMGGTYENFVYWTDGEDSHIVSLVATNYWECMSPPNIDTIQEPAIPDFGVQIISDTCALGKGGIIFEDTILSNAFFWLHPEYGPPAGTAVTSVYNIPAGDYDIRVSYLTPNNTNYAYYIQTFGTANCIDTVQYEIETIGMIEAEISISADVILEDLVAPEANVIFINSSFYDNVGKRCEWHFGDGTIQKTCDELVEHVYTTAGCFDPFLIVMNRDLLECRDTAYLETCVFVDDMSKLEIPNIFSPNADGVNDFFQVKAQTLRTFSGMIVNRWGRTVYTWENWQDYEAGWDGTLDGSTKASPGVYYYIIKAEGIDGTPYDKQGVLHLVSE